MATFNDYLLYLDDKEMGLCLRVNRLGRSEHVRRFFALVSWLGDWSFWALCGALLIAMQGTAALPLVLHIAVTGGIGVLVYWLLKGHLVRERPFVSNGRIRCGAAPLDRYSFPSGHTLHAVSFTILLSRVEPVFLLWCLPFAALVALSRVVLGLHYPSDVLVGAAIGATLASISVGLL